MLWFDFSYPGENGKGHLDWESEELIRLVRKLQPGIIVDNRLDLPGSGDILTPEQFTPDHGMVDEEGKPAVWEGCQTFSGSWGYFRDETSWKSVKMCIEMLVNHVSRGGNLLMNVGPTSRGYIDARAMERLAGYADWMKYEGWKENEVEYELYKTDDADLIISAYGISARIAKSAISILRNEGYKVGLIRPKRVYPFPVKPFAELCPDKIKGILDVEMSMPPQLLEDVAAATKGAIPIDATKGAIPIDTCLTSYGVIMNRDDIVAKAKEMLNK